MRKFKFKPPYKKAGKTAFPESRNQSGVYIIKENGKITYIGCSGSNIYKTMYRHFQAWPDSRQKRISYKTRLKRHKYTVRIIYCTPLQAMRLEIYLIKKYRPRDNKEKYQNFIITSVDEGTYQVYKQTHTEPNPF